LALRGFHGFWEFRNSKKVDKLVSAYLDGDIEKEIYLEKKEELMNLELRNAKILMMAYNGGWSLNK